MGVLPALLGPLGGGRLLGRPRRLLGRLGVDRVRAHLAPGVGTIVGHEPSRSHAHPPPERGLGLALADGRKRAVRGR